MVKRTILAIAIAMFSLSAFAQTIEEVTLTVSGDGATKEKATEVALRSAIEQAFGVFVSANTQILNDELVKDEIATVSSGNIKAYEEIATMTLPNGNTVVTLKAVVSVSKLISYAQSKGSSAEFAGATFGMNMKLKELNKANEEKAIKNLISQLGALTLFDYKLELGEPRLGKGGNYELPATVYALYNDNTEMANTLLLKTLASLSLSKEEREEYHSLRMDICSLYAHNTDGESDLWVYYDSTGRRRNSERNDSLLYFLRSSLSISMLCEYVDKLKYSFIHFKIVDNIGGTSTIDEVYTSAGHSTAVKRCSGLITRVDGDGYSIDIRPRYLRADLLMSLSSCLLIIPHLDRKYLSNDICYVIPLILAIPKDDIMKYNNFEITRK
jgi:hypothetical protein